MSRRKPAPRKKPTLLKQVQARSLERLRWVKSYKRLLAEANQRIRDLRKMVDDLFAGAPLDQKTLDDLETETNARFEREEHRPQDLDTWAVTHPPQFHTLDTEGVCLDCWAAGVEHREIGGNIPLADDRVVISWEREGDRIGLGGLVVGGIYTVTAKHPAKSLTFSATNAEYAVAKTAALAGLRKAIQEHHARP